MSAPTVQESQVKLGLLITILGGVLYTFDLPLLRLADNERWTLVFARGFLPFLALTAAWLYFDLWRGTKVPFISGIAGLGVIATHAMANIFFVGAIKTTAAANVVFIFAVVPVLTALFARVFLAEIIHQNTWIATVIALFGVGIIVSGGVNLAGMKGDIYAFLCACSTAATFTIIRASGKNLATSLGLGSLASSLIAYFGFGADLSLLFKSAAFGLPSWWWVVLNGLVVLPLSSALLANGPRYLPSSDVSMFFLLETILTPIWVWLLFNEVPNGTILLGGSIVVVTLFMHSAWRLRETLSPTLATPNLL